MSPLAPTALDDIIGSKIFDNTTKQLILIGIIREIQFFHENSFIHRDLKPRNILINDSFIPKIIYNDLLCLDNDKNQSNFPKITIMKSSPQFYAAPEMFNLDKQYDEKVDIYSFSIIMYQIITNQKSPYGSEKNGFKIASNVLNGVRPTFSILVKETLQNLIERCWSEDPDIRPTAKEIFAKLAYDHEYMLDDIDIKKISSYIKELNDKFSI